MTKRFPFPAFLTRVLSPLIIQSLVFFPASAQEETDYLELSVEQLFNATVVSATKTEEKWWTTPSAVYVLSSEDIIRSGATSIPEALRMVPGVQVARTGTAGWAVSVRGSNGALSNKLLVLMDGRDVYTPLFSGVYWDIQDTVLEDIERIEVVRGPGGTLWGANAVNGVINIITKKAADTQGNLISAIAGNQERAILSGRHGGKLPLENGYFRTYAKTSYRDEQRALSGGEYVDDWRTQRGGFRMEWDKGDRDSFNVQGEIYHSETAQNRNVPLLAPPFGQIEEEQIEAQGGHVLGSWSHSYSSKEKLTFETYLDYTARDQRALEDSNLAFDADLQYEFPAWDSHEFVVGGKYRLFADQLTQTSIATFEDSERRDNTFSTFIQDRIALVPETWYLTLGSKFEHNDYTGFEIQPNARLQWYPTETQTLWTSVSRAVRTPNRLESDLNLFLLTLPPSAASPFPTTFELLANPNMKSEELTAYEMGYRQEITPKLMLDASVFYNDYDNLATIYIDEVVAFTYRPNAISFLLGNSNEARAHSYGGETVLNWQARENLNLMATYSYLHLNIDDSSVSDGVNVEAPERESPRGQFNLRSQWDINKFLQLDSALYYVSSLAGRQNVEDYTRFDMRLGWKINEQLQFNLVGQNLLDDAHREFNSPTAVNATEIGRSIYGNMVWRF